MKTQAADLPSLPIKRKILIFFLNLPPFRFILKFFCFFRTLLVIANTINIGGCRGGGPGGHVPPLDHLKFSVFSELFFCWCTCPAKLAYRFMNIAGDERMCG